ncbi:MAG: PilZ domain-containing protein [Deltaproteobacteria bacterium]|jgi:hypothetical protein|nr:PilZ domain-containing protein [Deltaproteobacteria bacterium]MBT6431577.1 PilZ domain-containing protein [Deltaproteobacteria bacterium]MBT6488894.1 PilZ domain-containing protein [Deltaproteobacteria bacterium]
MSDESERRHYPRYDVNYEIKIHLASGGQTSARARDLSIGGMCVKGIPTWQADVGDKIKISIEVPDFFLTVTIDGEILWRDPDTKLVGVKFDLNEDEIMERVEKLKAILTESTTAVEY